MEEQGYWNRLIGHRYSRRAALRGGAAVTTLLGLGVSDIACSSTKGKSSNSASSGAASGSASGPRPTGATTSARRGGTLNVVHDTFPGIAVDPMSDIGAESGWLGGIYANGLLRIRDPKVYGTWTIEGDIAEKWEQPDPVTLIFHLRTGVKFHNLPPVNGRDLTAEDVKWNFDRYSSKDPSVARNALFQAIDAIQVSDSQTVTMKLKYHHYALPYLIGQPQTLMMSKEVFAQDGGFGKRLIGTGPFQNKSFNLESQIAFDRNPVYFKQGQPYADAVVVNIIPDVSARLAKIRSGQVQIDEDVPYVQVQALKQSNSRMHIEQYGGNYHWFIGFNCRPGSPVADVRVRQALQAALDPQKFIDILADGQGKRNPALWWWMQPWVIDTSAAYKIDPQKSKQLLAVAGVPSDYDLPVLVTGSDAPGQAAPFIEVAVDQWKQVGIKSHIETLDAGVYNKRVFSDHTFQCYGGNAPAHEDPDRLFLVFFKSTSPTNSYGWKNAAFDKAQDADVAAMTEAERKQALLTSQQIYIEQAPNIETYTAYLFAASQPNVAGYRPTASRGSAMRFLDEVYLTS